MHGQAILLFGILRQCGLVCVLRYLAFPKLSRADSNLGDILKNYLHERILKLFYWISLHTFFIQAVQIQLFDYFNVILIISNLTLVDANIV